MGIVIDHEARRRAIISKSIQLFSEQGYDGVTYQKIADSCGIARTTLYKYFHNKRQIFNYAIWEVAGILIARFGEILDPRESVVTRLDRLLHAVLQLLFEQHVILTVILDYVLAAQRTGQNLARDIARHTIGLRRVIHRLMVEGIRKKELRNVSAGLATEQLYAILEAASLRLTVSQNANYDELSALLHQAIENLRNPDQLATTSPHRLAPSRARLP
jgi:AcrR family transcriptional regulator